MKYVRFPRVARLCATAAVAAFTIFVAVSTPVVAKRSVTTMTKKSAPDAALRSIDVKQSEPGPAFATSWEHFRHGVASKRPASSDRVFGDSDVFVQFSALTGAPRVVYGDLGEAPVSAKTADRAMLWLEANAHVFGVDPSQLSLARSFDGPELPSHFYYDQMYKGLPVFYGEVAVHVAKDGHVWGVTNTFVPTNVSSLDAKVTAQSAFDIAATACGLSSASVIAELPAQEKLGIWPTSNGGRLAYRVTISSRNPAGHFETVVDAQSGEILEAPINTMCTIDGTGAVFNPNPVVSEGINNLADATSIPDSYYKATTLTGLDGSGKLIGTYSQVHPSMVNPAVRATNDFSDLRRTTNQFDEEEVYWAINTTEAAFQSLGYTVGNGNPIMNYSIKVYAHNSPTWGNADNSSFTGSNIDGPGTGILEFGTGGVDDAQDAEIIWHEYGHATLYNQRPGISQNLSNEGIGEGWGDYLAGAISKRVPGAQSYYVTIGEWDATSYNPGNPAFLRRLDNSAFWHGNGSEVHDAGETWSHPLFDYDNQVGTAVGLKLALQANFLFDLSPTQAEGAAAMVAADQMLYNGATKGQVNNAFAERHTPIGTGGPVGTVHPVVQTVAIAQPASSAFFLRNSSTSGAADNTVIFGANPTYTQLVGDWNGNGADTVGLYDPATGAFFLRNSNSGGAADTIVFFGSGGATRIPIVGDWDGNGTETIGLYDTTNGAFFLRNSNTPGPADLVFFFGAGGANIVPVIGDWDGNGTDTVGIFNKTNGFFFLKNSNSGGAADLTFQFGLGGATIVPLAGDWDGSGADSIGLYDSSTSVFFLKNTNASGSADLAFAYGAPGSVPLVGDFNGGMHPFNPLGG